MRDPDGALDSSLGEASRQADWQLIWTIKGGALRDFLGEQGATFLQSQTCCYEKVGKDKVSSDIPTALEISSMRAAEADIAEELVFVQRQIKRLTRIADPLARGALLDNRASAIWQVDQFLLQTVRKLGNQLLFQGPVIQLFDGDQLPVPSRRQHSRTAERVAADLPETTQMLLSRLPDRSPACLFKVPDPHSKVVSVCPL
ncbi:hypothetical protein ASD47_16140 [Caulobacter sp. Root1472]|nr:hypothetical protein ASD47_16140 [Caulobacter sp. Root1472]